MDSNPYESLQSQGLGPLPSNYGFITESFLR